MTQTNPVGRVLGAVVGPVVEVVGRQLEQRLAPDLPEPPWWAVPVAVVGGFVATVFVEDGRSERERAEPEPEAKAERGTTTASDGSRAVVEALEVLEVERSPSVEWEDVRAAYRARVMETHPDRGGEAERFVAVREAWETVTQREELSAGRLEVEVTQR